MSFRQSIKSLNPFKTPKKYNTQEDVFDMTVDEILNIDPREVSSKILENESRKRLEVKQFEALKKLLAFKRNLTKSELKSKAFEIQKADAIETIHTTYKEDQELKELRQMLANNRERLANNKKSNNGGKKRNTQKKKGKKNRKTYTKKI